MGYAPPQGLSPILTPTQQAGELDLVVNVKRDFGASGSSQTTTGTITAGSNVLVLANALDFENGQGIAIVNAGTGPYEAGTTTALASPAAPTVTVEGTAGTTDYSYAIAALDGNGGETAASAATAITTGNATLSSSDYNALSWTAVTGASGYAIYRTASAGTPSTTGFIGITNGMSFNDTGVATSIPPVGVATDAPTTALGDLFVTSITSGAGTTSLTLAATAANAVTGSDVLHDDTAAIQNALDNSGGGDVFFPPAQFNVSSALSVNQDGTRLIGSGIGINGGTTLSPLNPTQDVIHTNDYTGVYVGHLRIQPQNQTMLAGSAIVCEGQWGLIENVDANGYNGFSVKNSNDWKLNWVRTNCSNYGVYISGDITGIIGGELSGGNGAIYVDGGVNTVRIAHTELYGNYGLIMDNANGAGAPAYLWLYDVESNGGGAGDGVGFDFRYGNEVYMTECWNNSLDHAVRVGANFGATIDINGGRLGNSGSHNIEIDGGTNISIRGCHVSGVGTPGDATIYVAAGVSYWSVQNCIIGGYGTEPSYGVFVDAGSSDHYSVMGNIFNAVTTEEVFDSGTGQRKIVQVNSRELSIGAQGNAVNNAMRIANSQGWTILNTHGGINVGPVSPDILGYYNSGAGEQWFALDKFGNIGIPGNLFLMAGLQTLAGTTAGNAYWQMPLQGTYKKFVVYLDAYENDTTTAQTITFPTAFTYAPLVNNQSGAPGVTVTTTELSIGPDTTTAYTGYIEVTGF